MDKWLKNNLVVKILAVLLAFMLWMVVNQERIFEKSPAVEVSDLISKEINRVPIVGYLPAEDLVILDMAKSIDIVLRGKRDTLAAIHATSYEVYVDLGGFGEGKHNVRVLTKGFPAGVEVELRPAVIEVTLEAKQIKEMPVALEIVGNPREGYSLGTPIVSPSTVQVEAGASQLAKAAVAKVFMNVSDATEDLKRPISIKILDTNGNEIVAALLPPTVEITVPIIPPSVQLPIVPMIVGEPPSGFAVATIETDVTELSVFGPPHILAGLSTYPLPAVDISQMNSTQTVTVDVLADGGVHSDIVAVTPEVVHVTITIVPSEVLVLTDIPIRVEGLAAQDQLSFITPTTDRLSITLEGAADVLQKITKTHVQATIRVTDLTHGEYEIPIEWNIPTQTKLTKDVPKTVKVSLAQKSDETNTTPDEPSDSDNDHVD